MEMYLLKVDGERKYRSERFESYIDVRYEGLELFKKSMRWPVTVYQYRRWWFNKRMCRIDASNYWGMEIRLSVICIGGKPSQLDFFKQIMGHDTNK